VVEERLAACINIIGPIRSIYRWKGAIEKAEEVAAIFKTTNDQADRLITRIAGLHSYEVPSIATWPIDQILGSYAEWVEDSVG
jgi:periplasmic divalent cation tolerance protein